MMQRGRHGAFFAAAFVTGLSILFALGQGAYCHGAPARRLPENLLLGNPDDATGDPENRDHYLLLRKQYALSYNDANRFPNWVAWHLQASDIGTAERGQFQPDGFTRVTPGDYTNSGYDRGHNCPSKDHSTRREDNDATFDISNVTLQHGMNAEPWEQFESYCRTWCLTGQAVGTAARFKAVSFSGA